MGAVEEKVPRKRRSPGELRLFYADSMGDAERADFLAAVEEGEDEEIALLRLLIRRVLQQRPEDLRLLVRSADYLGKALTRRFRLNKGDKEDLEQALAEVLHEVRMTAEGEGQ